MSEQKKTIFVSDLHIRGLNDPKMKVFLSFLDSKKDEMSHLVIGGDLFDLWVGYNSVVHREYGPVLEKLGELKKRGVQIDYVEGNHDFDLAPYFRDILKINVIEDGTEMKVGHYNLFLAHGDQVNPKDHGYHFLRWLLRTAFMKWVIRVLPAEWIWSISRRSSHVSRTYRTAHGDTTELFRKYAQKILNSTNIDVVVLGHTHHPDAQVFEVQNRKKYYFNTGDWISHNTYLEHYTGEFSLKKFDFDSAP